MSQRQQLERVLEIDRQIRAGLYPNADRLAAELEVSRRVIFMDRQFMVERLKAPIIHDRKHGGWRYRDATWMLPSTMVSEGELLAFALGIEAARRAVGTALEAPLKSAVEKITRSLRGPVQVDLASLQRHCSFGSSSAVAVDERTLLSLLAAISESRSVRMDYFTAESNTSSRRVVDPYHLHHVNGAWYLIAFDYVRLKILTFHVGRIRSLEIKEQSFTRDPGFDAEQWLRSAFQAESGEEVVDFAIRFDDYQAVFIRDRVWHPSQRIEELPHGELILHFQSSSWGEVLRFVLQYGSHAEVLSPVELRHEVAVEVAVLNQRYSRDFMNSGETTIGPEGSD